MGKRIEEITSKQIEYLRTNVEADLGNFIRDSKKRIVRIQKNIPTGYAGTILPYPRNYDKLVGLGKSRITIYDKNIREGTIKRGRLMVPNRKVSATRYIGECLNRCDEIVKQTKEESTISKLDFFRNLDWTLKSYEGSFLKE